MPFLPKIDALIPKVQGATTRAKSLLTLLNELKSVIYSTTPDPGYRATIDQIFNAAETRIDAIDLAINTGNAATPAPFAAPVAPLPIKAPAVPPAAKKPDPIKQEPVKQEPAKPSNDEPEAGSPVES